MPRSAPLPGPRLQLWHSLFPVHLPHASVQGNRSTVDRAPTPSRNPDRRHWCQGVQRERRHGLRAAPALLQPSRPPLARRRIDRLYTRMLPRHPARRLAAAEQQSRRHLLPCESPLSSPPTPAALPAPADQRLPGEHAHTLRRRSHDSCWPPRMCQPVSERWRHQMRGRSLRTSLPAVPGDGAGGQRKVRRAPCLQRRPRPAWPRRGQRRRQRPLSTTGEPGWT